MTKILPVTKEDITIGQRPKRAISWIVNLEAMCPQDIHKAHVPVQLLPHQTPHARSEWRMKIWKIQIQHQIFFLAPSYCPTSERPSSNRASRARLAILAARRSPSNVQELRNFVRICSDTNFTWLLVLHLLQASLTKSLPMGTHWHRHKSTPRIASIQNHISPLSPNFGRWST